MVDPATQPQLVPNAEREGAAPPVWKPLLLGAAAGGLGWGIRGQYGHETGAMFAGLLVGLTLVLLFRKGAASLPAARAVAWCTIAIGFGGSMTYGQTVGLTHDPALVGNWDALRWGMLGLAIKGGIWIGFAGLFLGMGLGGTGYRPRELTLLMIGLLAVFFIGVRLLNSPFDPANRTLPPVYFSSDWSWFPGKAIKPRPEVWGGLLLALVTGVAYTGIARRDGLALRLAAWGIAGGAIGFPLGQSLQAFHAWNLESFRTGWLAGIDPLINWWNFMETTFGATMGAALGLELWLHRARIAPLAASSPPEFPPGVEFALLAVHLALLTTAEFLSAGFVGVYTELGLLLGLIPIVAVAGGRWWPYFAILPVTFLPIAGKTLRNLAYEEGAVAPWVGWIVYVIVPLGIATFAAVRFAQRAASGGKADAFLRPALLIAVWLGFGLNFAFFRFPSPWATPTNRMPNAIVFAVCAALLTWAAWKRTSESASRTGDAAVSQG